MAGVNEYMNKNIKTETAKSEHEQLLEMEKMREAAEHIRIMFDMTPLSANLWDKNFKVIDCNQEALKTFNMSDKQEYLDNFHRFSPEFQPNGRLSKEVSLEYVKKAFEKGYLKFEWTRQTLDGELIPMEVTMVRVDYRGEPLVAAYSRDLREHNRIMAEIEQRDNMLNAVNRTAAMLLTAETEENTNTNILESMELIGLSVDVDRVQIWKNEEINGELYFVHTYEWLSDTGKKKVPVPIGLKFPYSAKPEWERMFLRGEYINAPVSLLPEEDKIFLTAYDMKSIAIIPLFLQERFWGFFSVDDCRRERVFTGDEINIMQSASLMMASALLRNDIIQDTRDTAAQLDAVISNYAGVIWSVNTEGIITLFNGLYLNKIGVTPDFVEGKSLEHARLKNRHLDIIEKVNLTIAEGQPQDWISDIDGLKFHARTMPLYDENRQITGVVGSIDEVTEMIEMQERLKEQNANMLEMTKRVQYIFDANPFITVLFNDKFKVIDCNPAAMEFMGFDTKEELLEGFVGRLVKSIPEVQSSGRRSIPLPERFMTTVKEGLCKFETDLVIDGRTRNIYVEFKKIPYENSFAIVAYVFDMTEAHTREMELLRSRELNELRLIKLNLATKAAKVGLWDTERVYDESGNPAYTFTWSDEFRQMLGFENETDFPNDLSVWSERVHPDDREEVFAAYDNHLLDKTGKTPYDVEYRLLKKNGEYSYFRDSCETIRDEEGNAVRAAGALIDITETKNILLDTERQRIEAEAANKAKSSFLSTMSHEIRTPMNAILGITEIQLQNESLDQNLREALDKIHISGDMLLGIINDILDLSKIEAGKLELLLDNYEIASLISDTAQLNMMRIGSKPIEFELEINENLPALLLGDELRVKQILNNILSNAFKYTAAGTVKLVVSVEEIPNNKDKIMLVCSVSDTGQGMTKEQVNKLFDEYSRFNMEANRSTEGTGLGMSITRNLIRMMNGEIFIESEPGKGSTFTVRLPQGKVGTEILGKESAENLHQFRSSSRAQMKRVQIAREPMPYGSVLIVDDVETNIYVAKGLLIPYGLNIDAADSGFAAIEKIKNGSVYDIVFMDHMMPKMDGIEATKILRNMGYTQPIVALTANAVTGQAEIFLKNGFDDYISKPIDVRQLNAVLNKLVRDKQPHEVIMAARYQSENKKEAPPEPANQMQSGVSARFAEIFSRDALKSLAALEAINAKNGVYEESDIRTYVIHTHGMKSALANIGKMELSAVALKLEVSGRDGDTEVIKNETPGFIASLRALVEELAPKKEKSAEDESAAVVEDLPYLREKLLAIKAACEEYDEKTADDAISELKNKTWSQKTKDLLDGISENLLHSDFDLIVEMADKFLEAK